MSTELETELLNRLRRAAQPAAKVPESGVVKEASAKSLAKSPEAGTAVYAKSVLAGTYLLSYNPVQPWPGRIRYDGTLRMEQKNQAEMTASGDLYVRRIFPEPDAPPSPGAGIPVFPIASYTYYLKVISLPSFCSMMRAVAPSGDSYRPEPLQMKFEMWRFDWGDPPMNPTQANWTNLGAMTAAMNWASAPSTSYPLPGEYLWGDVFNSAGIKTGTMTMGWVAPQLRKVTVEIDKVQASEWPMDNGAGVDWKGAFNDAMFETTAIQSDAAIGNPHEFWSDAECHAAMLAHRDRNDLDKEWRYYLLCVRRLVDNERGVMFDGYGSDSNNVPREGAAVATAWTIPAKWGKVSGMRFGTTPCYFRAAVHEIGHAMGLLHTATDNGFMQPTPEIAASDPVNFPDNIQWRFNPEDAARLRHMPDLCVRPGGIAYGMNSKSTPMSTDDLAQAMPGLELTVKPLLEAVPMGAPVRVDIELKNVSKKPLTAPESLSLKTGFVTGKAIDPSGTVRAFAPIVLHADADRMCELAPGKSVTGSITLLRGPDGVLFPAAGLSHVVVNVNCFAGGTPVRVTGRASVMIMAHENALHAAAARKIFDTPDALLTLAIGGDHLDDGVAALGTALDNKTLRPHFAVVEARRIARRFQKREPDFKTAADLLHEQPVMTVAEAKTMADLFKSCASQTTADHAAKALRTKARQLGAEDALQDAIHQIERKTNKVAG